MHLKRLVITLFLASSPLVSAIKCDFQYEQAEIVKNSSDVSSNPNSTSSNSDAQNIPSDTLNSSDFSCDEDLPKRPEGGIAVRWDWLGDEWENDNDKFTEVEHDCKSTSSTIRPTMMSNVENIMTPVHQNETIKQEIAIEKCDFSRDSSQNKTWSPCRSGVQTPRNQKNICHHLYQRIILLAKEVDSDKIDYMPFYYPSKCVCELINLP